MTKTIPLEQRPHRCPQCGSYALPHESHCPDCGYPVAPLTPAMPKTGPLTRRPLTLPVDQQGDKVFEAETHVLLQFLPSGSCLTLPLDSPTILGRGHGPTNLEFVDLADFSALQHGVSRLHCRLERRDNRLLVMDLGSSNGTYVNDEPLLPHHEKVVASGDRLILGSLHVSVCFSSTQ